MQMLSTRGAAAVSPSMAILRGLAPDGGLYVPAAFPSFTAEEIRSLAKAEAADLVDFFAKLETLVANAGCDMIISFSDDAANVPESIRKYQI